MPLFFGGATHAGSGGYPLRAATLLVLLLMPNLPALGAPAPGLAAIVIVRDEGPTGFVLGHEPLTGEPLYRPGSGVTSGRGTPEDPYVIASPVVARIHLRDTSAHVVVRDATVEGSTPALLGASTAILLENASHVRVTGSRVEGAPALVVAGGSGIRIDNSTLRATRLAEVIRASDARDVLVHDNEITNEESDALFAERVLRLDAARNVLLGQAPYGYTVVESRDVVVREHAFVHGPEITQLRANVGTRYESNRAAISHGTQPVLLAEGETGLVVRETEIVGVGEGIFLADSADVRIDRVQTDLVTALGALHCVRTNRTEVTSSRLVNQGGPGIAAHACDGLRVAESSLVPLYADGGRDLLVEDSEVDGPSLAIGHGMTLRRSVFRHGEGIVLLGQGMTVEESSFAGFLEGSWFITGAGSRLAGNTFRDSRSCGLCFYGSRDTVVERSGFENVSDEIYVEKSTNLTFGNHSLVRGILVFADAPGELHHTIGAGFRVHGRPVLLLHGASGAHVPDGYGQVFVSESTNVTIESAAFHNVTRAITTFRSNDVTIRGGSIVDSDLGLDSAYDASLRVIGTEFRRNAVGVLAWDAANPRLEQVSFVANLHGALADMAQGSTLTLVDASVHDNGLVGVLTQQGGVDLRRSSFLANGLHPNFSYRPFGFPGDPALVTFGTDVTVTTSRFAGNELAHWTVGRSDASRNSWGCPDGPNATGCDTIEAWGETITAPWCANDVYAEGSCDEHGAALSTAAFTRPAAPAAARLERAPAALAPCYRLPAVCAVPGPSAAAPTEEPLALRLPGARLLIAPSR